MSVIQSSSSTKKQIDQAMDVILKRYSNHILNFVRGKSKGCDFESIVQDTFVRATEKFNPTQGKLKPFLFRIATNLLLDEVKALQRLRVNLAPDEDESPTCEDEALFSEICRQVHRVLKSMSNADNRLVFMWRSIMGLPLKDLRDLWPDVDYAAIRKMHSRAVEKFEILWATTPGQDFLEVTNSLIAARSQGMTDPDNISDPENKRVYTEWIAARSDGVPAVAKKLGLSEKEVRERVLDSIEDLLQISEYRGSQSLRSVDFSKLSGKGGILSDYLEFGRDRAEEYMALPDEEKRLCDVLNRQFLLMRIAMGFAPLSDATHTIGSLLHKHVMDDGPEAYDQWADDLDLSKPRFLRLLGDDLEPSEELLKRLSGRLGMDCEALRRLKSNRSETRIQYRDSFDNQLSARIRNNVLARIGK